jgi:hypothetical protein
MAKRSAPVDRDEILDGLQHLIELAAWYVRSADPHAYDEFGAGVVEDAARAARRHLGWVLRDRLELKIARAINLVAAEFLRVGKKSPGPWKQWAVDKLQAVLSKVPTRSEQTEARRDVPKAALPADTVGSVISTFLRAYERDTASTDGAVELLIDAVNSTFMGKTVTAYRPVRKLVRDGLPVEALPDLAASVRDLVEVLNARRDQTERNATLMQDTWTLRRRPKAARLTPRAMYVPLDEMFDPFLSKRTPP